MSDIRDSIKDAIEKQVENGDWHGISADEGRYEGNVDALDIDPDSIEIGEVDMDAGTIAVSATGVGTATHTDADGVEVTGNYDVVITAEVNITFGDASNLRCDLQH